MIIFTGKQLTELIGVESRKTIYNWLNGSTEIRFRAHKENIDALYKKHSAKIARKMKKIERMQ